MTTKQSDATPDDTPTDPESEFPVPTGHTVTVGFARKLTDGNYGSHEASLFETITFAEPLTETQVELLRAAVFAKQKAQVFSELGISAELNEEGILLEVAKTFAGAKPAGRQPAAPAPSRAAPPPEYDEEPFGPDDYDTAPPRQERRPAQRQAPMDPIERDWTDFMNNPDGFFDDLMEPGKAKIKRKAQGAEARWLNAAPQWVKDWAEQNGIPIPPMPRGGGGGRGGGYGGGQRTGGGGGYRR